QDDQGNRQVHEEFFRRHGYVPDSRIRVGDGITDAGSPEPFASNAATVATTTGGPVFCWIITAMGEMKRNLERRSFPNDVRFRHLEERGSNLDSLSHGAGAGAQSSHMLKCPEIVGTTVRIPRVIEHVGPNIDQ